jgi:hypothetical protein
MDDGEELVRSDTAKSGYKGVGAQFGRFQAKCTTSTCRNSLGTFGTPEEAAQAYLQHYRKEHPEELEKERAPPLKVQEHLLIRSDKATTGFKGVQPHNGRFQGRCNTPPCRRHLVPVR